MPQFSLLQLAANPWVGVTYGNSTLPLVAEHVARAANGAAAHLLARPMQHAPDVLPRYVEHARAIAASFPNVHLTFAASTAQDDQLYRDAGLSSIWCSHNAFVDETLFAPRRDAVKLYDAVYVGRLHPVKRLELAAMVPRMAIVTGRYLVDEPYASQSLAQIADLRFANYDPGRGVTFLQPSDVHQVLTAARCGLALSANEGAMYASIEYLLSGLPVVTTPSDGGRDVFFHTDYVEMAAPEPTAVAAAVARIIARAIDPQMIHDRTVELMKAHRARLLMWLSGIVQQNLFAAANANLWLPPFTNKLETWITT